MSSCSKVSVEKLILFDHLVGGDEQLVRHREAERPGCLEIEDKLERGWLQDRHFCRVGAFQDLSDVDARLTIHPADAWTVA